MLDQVCQLARNAGDAIMQVYDGTKPMDVVSKADNSPVTAADIAAHTVIMRPPLVVISRSHADAELKEYLQQLGEHQTTSIGSSLKFCLVAEGQAQLYPRFGPTNIWDTAAGHAVAAAAGAHVHDWQGKPLDYTPRESFLNPWFRVSIY